MSVVKIIEVIGMSKVSFEKAVEGAVKTAAKTLQHITGAEVVGQNVKVGSKGKITEYRAVVRIAFKYDPTLD